MTKRVFLVMALHGPPWLKGTDSGPPYSNATARARYPASVAAADARSVLQYRVTIANGGVLPQSEAWWTKLVGIAALVLLCLAVIPVLVLALPFLAVRAWLDRRKRRRLQREFHNRWGAHGKRLLLVYSNSPNWQAYVEENWLPQLEPFAVVLNWSERKTWSEQHPFEAEIFRTWAGDQEFNPLAIIIPADGAVRVVRFWQAFRDYKHGKDRTLRAAEAELGAALGVPLRARA